MPDPVYDRLNQLEKQIEELQKELKEAKGVKHHDY